MKTVPRCEATVPVRMMLALLLLPSALHSAEGSDQIPARPQSHPIAIKGATLHPVSAPDIANGTILFDKGKIVQLGSTVSLPPNTEVIDGTGNHVYPGLISSNSTIGLVEIPSVRASVDASETGQINPNVRAEVAVNPESELIPVLRANGVALAVAAPTGGLIAGTSALLALDGWTWEDLTLKAPLAMYLNWPPMQAARSRFGRERSEDPSIPREESLKELRNAFRDARAYLNAKKAEKEKGIPHHRTDVRWEAMVPVLEGNLPLVVWANDIEQIEAAVSWARAENLRIIIGGGHDAWRVAGLLKANDIPVLAGGMYRLPARRFEEYDEPYSLPSKLQKAGIRFAIISQESPSNERNLPYHAGAAAAFGLPKEEALKAITLYPAQIFGIADRVGSLEAGKDATLILTTGDPLEIRTTIVKEYIQGRSIDLTSKQTVLYEKYKEKYRRLQER